MELFKASEMRFFSPPIIDGFLFYNLKLSSLLIASITKGKAHFLTGAEK